MKIKELLDQLSKLDPEAEVFYSDMEYGDQEPYVTLLGKSDPSLTHWDKKLSAEDFNKTPPNCRRVYL